MADKTLDKNEVPQDGVVSREDHGKFEVVRGMRGEVAVLVKDGEVLTPEEQVAKNDLLLELSATPVEEDPRHSSNPDFTNPDGSPAGGSGASAEENE